MYPYDYSRSDEEELQAAQQRDIDELDERLSEFDPENLRSDMISKLRAGEASVEIEEVGEAFVCEPRQPQPFGEFRDVREISSGWSEGADGVWRRPPQEEDEDDEPLSAFGY